MGVCGHLAVGVSAPQQDLIVDVLPLGVVVQGHDELTHAGHEVLRHPLLVLLQPPHHVLQLQPHTHIHTHGYSHSLCSHATVAAAQWAEPHLVQQRPRQGVGSLSAEEPLRVVQEDLLHAVQDVAEQQRHLLFAVA